MLVVKIMTYLASVHIAFAGIALKMLTVQWIATQCRSGFWKTVQNLKTQTGYLLTRSRVPSARDQLKKNLGCMHMTCTLPCIFEFCWLCLGPWSKHPNCNAYGVAKQDENEKRREMAKKSLEKYTHYYERWASNNSSRQKALADLHQMQTVHVSYTHIFSVWSSYLPWAKILCSVFMWLW